MTLDSKVFELSIGGIRCTNCAKKIKDNLLSINKIHDVKVNVMQEKALIELSDQTETDQLLNNIQDKLKELKFEILSAPKQLNISDQTHIRKIYFKLPDQIQIQNQDIYGESKENLNQIMGVTKTETTNFSLQPILEVSYNSEIIKARQISEILQKNNPNLQFCDEVYLENLKHQSPQSTGISTTQFRINLIVLAYFLSLTLIYPYFFENEFYNFVLYPTSTKIYTLYTFLALFPLLYTLKTQGITTYKIAYQNWREFGSLNMETLIGLGSFSSLLMSIYLLIKYSIEDQEQYHLKMVNIKVVSMFQATSMILLIVSIGKYIETKAKNSINSIIDQMFPQDQYQKEKYMQYIEPKNRNLVILEEKQVEIGLLDKHDLVRIQSPMTLMVDGIILQTEDNKGIQVVDSICFGDQTQQTLQKGERVKSGSVIKGGKAIMQVENTVENSILQKISQQITISQGNQDAQQDGISILLKKLSEYFVSGMVIIAIAVLIIWTLGLLFDIIRIDESKVDCIYCIPFEKSIATVVASCPCALGLAIPCVVAITLNLAMKNNILIKNTKCFEYIGKVQSVVFDKTGTLFTRIDKILDIRQLDDTFENEQIWQIISLMEKSCIHPIAYSLYKESLEQLTNPHNLGFSLKETVKIHQNGISGTIQAKKNGKLHEVLIGNILFMQTQGIEVSDTLKEEIISQEQLGQTIILLSINGILSFKLNLDNNKNLRPEAKEVIHFLQHTLKKQVCILSGDNRDTIQAVGEYLEIPQKNLYYQKDQEQKKQLIQQIREEQIFEDGKVMMIGDGLNDILSLQEADIGVSINTKSNLNLAVSDVILLNENLWKIVSLFKLLDSSRKVIYINLFWAFLYNLLMIPMATGVFYSLNIHIQPVTACFFMSLSSLVVVGFSNILRLVNIDYQKKTKSSLFSSIFRRNKTHLKLINEDHSTTIESTRKQLNNQHQIVSMQELNK